MGRYVKSSIIAETIYGNGGALLAATAFAPLRAKSVSYPVDRGLLIEENIESYIPVAAYGGALKVSGTIEGNFRPNQMSQMIASCFGTGAATTSPFTGMAYTMGMPTSMQLKVGEQTASGGSYEIELGYVGVGIKTMNLTLNSKEFVVAKFDWFAKQYTAASTYTAPADSEYEAEDPAVFYNALVSLDGGSTWAANIRNATINIDRKVDEDRYVLGDFTVQELGINGMTDVSGDFTFTEKEYSMFKAALFGAATATTIPTTNPVYSSAVVVKFTDQAEDDVAQMALGTVVFGNTDTTMTGQNVIEKKVSWKATGDAGAFKFSVKT
jgi:hypothetical protein